MARFLASLAVLVACKHPGKAPPVARAEGIPRVTSAIRLDGELDEPAWNALAFRAVLAGDDGQQARPYSELRLLHDDTQLYVALYAADENILSTDAWDLEIAGRHYQIDAAGRASVPTGVDRDGTLDQPDDFDEEWVIEAAVPLPTSSPVTITAKRCDTPKDGVTRCGQWHRDLALQ
jgi:hypothetical protein